MFSGGGSYCVMGAEKDQKNDGRKRVIEGDIGDGTIDGIMGNYLKKIFGKNYDD